ncbi:BPSL0761 family protein [Burkholderia diffusa]|uniref:BPSL0761 family protein n=1 Tax=Burkholderia diffusa TaxID=488732 RepID=UPI0009C0851E
MTTPYERTKAVIETREFLKLLASPDGVASRREIQAFAVRLLRHYPLDIDLGVSAAALPGLWTAPQQR